MPYHIDCSKISLKQFRASLNTEDLVPSRKLLMIGIDEKFCILSELGYSNVALLLKDLKKKKAFHDLVKRSGIDEQYLVILSQEIRSHIPKAEKLSDFTGFDENAIHSLFEAGYKNTKLLWEAGLASEKREIIAMNTKTKLEDTNTLVRLSDLCRVRWVNSSFSQMLWMAEIRSAAELAAANCTELHACIVALNKKHKWYKGSIGLNDFRLVKKAAKRLSFDLKI